MDRLERAFGQEKNAFEHWAHVYERIFIFGPWLSLEAYSYP